MIHVCVHWPVREHHVGIVGGEESPHRVHLRLSHLGRAVDLAEEHRLRAYDLAGGLALGGTNLRRFVYLTRARAPRNAPASRRTPTLDRPDARRHKRLSGAPRRTRLALTPPAAPSQPPSPDRRQPMTVLQRYGV